MRSIYTLLYRLLYNQLAWAYDSVSWAVSMGRWDNWRRAALPFVRGDRVLEVGFGTGELLPVLRSGQRQVIGIEPSAAMQRISEQKLRTREHSVPRVQGIAQQLPFDDNVFDSIVSTFPASFILDRRAHLEFARCLRPGGRLIVVEVTLTKPEPLLRFLFQLIFPSPPAAFAKLEAAFEVAGLTWTEHKVGQAAVRPLVIVAEKQARR